MNNTKVLSIIIPTYNMSAYINRCLDSLLIKELDKLEVLVIIDGSKDDSSEKAHVYQDKYPGTFRVIDKENGNYGSCINRGLRELTGRFVKVLDADDWYDTQELNHLVEELDRLDSDVDMVVTHYQICDAKGNTQKVSVSSNWEYGRKYSVEEFFSDREFFRLAMHMVLYRADLFKEFTYFQTEGISYTDVEWVFKPLYYVKNIVFVNADVYRYLLGREGQTMDPSVKIRTLNHEWKSCLSMMEFNMNNSISGQNAIAYTQFRINVRLVNIYIDSLFYMDDDSFAKFDLKSMDDVLKNQFPMFYDSVISYDIRGKLVSLWRMRKKRNSFIVRKMIAGAMSLFSKIKN